ncbi:MAG: L,D-transpeptidase family protein [Actinobacteria bacterium]|nr:L,D-transpeptidase family protein [Actinomycetota bacterium]
MSQRRPAAALGRAATVFATTVLLLATVLTPAASAATRTCRGLAPTITADAGGGAILGTRFDDVILGTPGDDVILGRGGNDTICGLGGDDEISGGAGDDWIDGNAGADVIHGNSGDDIISGGSGSDVLDGGTGANVLRGKSGNDTIDGGPDRDRIAGGNGADVLRGNGGDDTISGGGGPDALEGGDGADRLLGRSGGDAAFGGDGPDEILAGSGVDECDGETLLSCEKTAVSPGDEGPSVAYLQKRLTRARLYRGPIDGVYPDDPATLPGDFTAAVYAFHKLHQAPSGDVWTADDHVSAEWTLADWHLLEGFEPAPPVARDGEPDRFEVDATAEVMWLILDGEVAGIFHVSVGGEFTYWYSPNQAYEVAHTPRGDLDVDHYSLVRYRQTYWMYRAWYYKYTHRWMALHGYYTVPPYPASHGCVRVTYDDADWIYARVGAAPGWPFHIWDG